MRRLTILYSAYACGPDRGSESAVGWSVPAAVARRHSVYVVTTSRYRVEIERALSRPDAPNFEVVFFDGKFGFLQRGLLRRNLHYYLWQIGCALLVRRMLRTRSIDLIHHLTWARYWTPSFLGLLGAPLVWGPVGGGEDMPIFFRRALSWRARLVETVRRLSRFVGERDPFVKMTMRQARHVFVSTRETAARIGKRGNVEIYSQVGVEAEFANADDLRRDSPGDEFNVVTVGRLEEWKGIGLLLRAFAKVQRRYPECRLCIVGDGPQRAQLRAEGRRLGIQDSVTFCGKVDRASVREALHRADVAVQPSLHDSGGMACVEAMCLGKPVVCLGLGGPREIVTDDAGVVITPSNPREVVEDIARALAEFRSNPAVLREKSAGARVRGRMYLWENRVRRYLAIYEEISRASIAEPSPAIAPAGTARQQRDANAPKLHQNSMFHRFM